MADGEVEAGLVELGVLKARVAAAEARLAGILAIDNPRTHDALVGDQVEIIRWAMTLPWRRFVRRLQDWVDTHGPDGPRTRPPPPPPPGLLPHDRGHGCDAPTDDCQIDHRTPASAGGPTSQDNGRAYCGPHNRARNHPDYQEPDDEPPLDE